jgi:hypothetical protein
MAPIDAAARMNVKSKVPAELRPNAWEAQFSGTASRMTRATTMPRPSPKPSLRWSPGSRLTAKLDSCCSVSACAGRFELSRSGSGFGSPCSVIVSMVISASSGQDPKQKSRPDCQPDTRSSLFAAARRPAPATHVSTRDSAGQVSS